MTADGGLNVDTLSVAIGGVPAIVAAYFSYRASTRANAQTAETNRIAATKVDAEAYERGQRFYREALEQAERQIDRLREENKELRRRIVQLEKTVKPHGDVDE